MLGNRIKRSAIVLAVFVVLMMAFFAMAKEVHAETVHVRVTTNIDDALERVTVYGKWQGIGNMPGSDNMAITATEPAADDYFADLNWEYQVHNQYFPGFCIFYKFDSDAYILEDIQYTSPHYKNEFGLTEAIPIVDESIFEDWFVNMNNYHQGGGRIDEAGYNTYLIYATQKDWTGTDSYAESDVWGEGSGYTGQYNGFIEGWIVGGTEPELWDHQFHFVFSKNIPEDVSAFEDAITALPEAINLTADNKEAVESARRKYNALTPELQALVSDESVKKLIDAEKMISLFDQIEQANAAKKVAEEALLDAQDALEKAVQDAKDELKKALEDAKKVADEEKAAAVSKALEDAAIAAEQNKQDAVEAALKEAAIAAEKEKNDAVSEAVAEAKAALKDVQAAKDKAEADLKDAQDAKVKAEADLKDAQDAKVKAEADLKDAQDAKDKAEADLKAAQEAKEKAEADKAAAEQALNEAQSDTFAALTKVSLGKVKGAKKKLTVNWTKVADAKGYEIIVAKNKKGTKDAKTYTVKKGSAVKKTIKKLAKGKYFVKVRAYKEYNGNTVYGAFSKAKKVKVK